MCNSPGNGKTHLAAAAANTLGTQGRAVLFATAPEFSAMVRDGFNAGQAEDLTGACQRVPWLVVDDLRAERLTDWAAEASARAQPSGAVPGVQRALHCQGTHAGGEQRAARGGAGTEAALPVS
jgi:hypothetical protein